MCLLISSFPRINLKLPDSPTTRCGWWSEAAGRRWWGRRLLRLSLLRTPASPPWSPVCSSPPPRRCFKGTGCAERRDAEYPLNLLPLLWLPQHGWTAASARRLVRAVSLVLFLFWINSSGVAGRYAGSSWANKPVLWCCFLRLPRTRRWRTRERAPTVTPLMERLGRTRAGT